MGRAALADPNGNGLQSLYDCVAKEAGVLDDKNTALTVAFLRERCSPGGGRMKTSVELRDTNWPMG